MKVGERINHATDGALNLIPSKIPIIGRLIHQTPGGKKSLKLTMIPAIITFTESTIFAGQEILPANSNILFPIAVGLVGLASFIEYETLKKRGVSANAQTLIIYDRLKNQNRIKNEAMKKLLENPALSVAISNLLTWVFFPTFAIALIWSVSHGDPSTYIKMFSAGALGASYFGSCNLAELLKPGVINQSKKLVENNTLPISKI